MERVDESKGGEEPSMRPEVTTTIGAFTAFLFEYEKLKQNLKFSNTASLILQSSFCAYAK